VYSYSKAKDVSSHVLAGQFGGSQSRCSLKFGQRMSSLSPLPSDLDIEDDFDESNTE